jgi:transcription antitermination factor NusA-like protein
MIKTIDMKDLRHLNLFAKITRIDTRYSFNYNETIMFCVPKSKIPQALGERGSNLKRMSDILKKRIRILPIPRGDEDLESFIKMIVAPVEFKEIKFNGNEVILTAGIQSKAALLGRNKRRLIEMQKIVKDFFGKEFKII